MFKNFNIGLSFSSMVCKKRDIEKHHKNLQKILFLL